MSQKKLGRVDTFILKAATRRIDQPAGLMPHFLDKWFAKQSVKILEGMKLKSAGMSGGLPFAHLSDDTPYTIGDAAKNYVNHGYEQNPIVYSIIRLITTAASKAKFKLVDCTDKKDPKTIEDHPLLDLLARPSPLYGRREFVENTLSFLLLTGEAFIAKQRGTLSINKGSIMQLIIMSPEYITVTQDKTTGLASQYVYQGGKQKIFIDVDDMIFMSEFNPKDDIRGQSPLKAGRSVMAHSNDSYMANRKLLLNGGASGILSMGNGTDVSLQDPQIDALQEKFRERYAGPERYGTPIITNQPLTWTEIGMNGTDMNLIEGQLAAMRDICNVYGISSQLLNDTVNKTYNNMQEARIALITQCVIPKLHTWLDNMNRDLVPEFQADGQTLSLELDKSCWEELNAAKLTEATMLSQAYWLTINEKRAVMGYTQLTTPEGDDMYMPLNLMPISTSEDAQSQLRNAHAQATQGVAQQPAEEQPAEDITPTD